MTEYSPHQQRVIHEKQSLDEKLSKLVEFQHSDKFIELTKYERELLNKQAEVMNEYSDILLERIDLF